MSISINKYIPISLSNVLAQPSTSTLVVSLEKWWNSIGVNDKKTLLSMFKKSTMYIYTPYKSLSKDIQQELRKYYNNKLRILGLEGHIKVI